VAVDIRPLDDIELWSRPDRGHLPRWVRGVIAFACVITVGVIAASAHVLWRMDGHKHVPYSVHGVTWKVAEWLWQYLPPLIFLAILVIAFLPRSTLSRFVRMAIVLPLVHVLALLVAWQVIPRLQLPTLGERTPLTREFPPLPMALLVAGAIITAGTLVTRRARERIHAIVMLALVNLLLLGLWVPIVSRLMAAHDRSTWADAVLSSWSSATSWMESPWFFPILLLPPFTVAVAFTAIAINRPARARRLRVPVAVLAIALFGAAVSTRLTSYSGAFLIYDNVVHILLGTVLCALLATSALAVHTWLATRRAARRLANEREVRAGLIDDDDDPIVACLEISSWLRGPRVISRPFNAVTANGDIVVPAGAEIAMSIPPVTSVMRNGEAVVVLRQSDVVHLGGFVEAETGESPFRSTQAVIPGPRGVVVGRVGDEETSALQSMGLAAWRPSVAYMLIVIVVAIPGLLGLFSPTWK
jgi:hypothetical protein